MPKHIKLKTESRESLMRGIDLVCDAVGATIGPRGRNAVIGRTYGPPKITNDGVTIAKEIELEDPFENAGAAIMKDVAERTNQEAGDGTTTATVLTQMMMRKGMKHIVAGVNVMALRRGMERAGEDVIRTLKECAKPVKDEEIEEVATIAAESPELGKIIADTIKKVGRNGVVTVEESHTFGIEADIVEGMELANGYISPAMFTNIDKMEAEYRDVDVLLTDRRISMLSDILPFLNKMTEAGKKALIIIGDVEGDALKTLLYNKLRGGFAVLAVKPPGFGEDRKEILSDIAVTVGATVVSDDTGITLANADLSILGSAHRVVSKEKVTTIIGGAGKREAIDARIASLQERVKDLDVKFSREKMLERIGKLSGGVAILRVGAATEGDMTYLKDKIEDAVNATRAAIEEGIVPGGGAALVKIRTMLLKNVTKDTEGIGYGIVMKALQVPLAMIALNAGKKWKKWWQFWRKDEINNILEYVGTDPYTGYNAVTDELVPDMLTAGIVDPVKVTRTAVKRAVSASAILITTEVAIVDAVKDLLK